MCLCSVRGVAAFTVLRVGLVLGAVRVRHDKENSCKLPVLLNNAKQTKRQQCVLLVYTMTESLSSWSTTIYMVTSILDYT